MGRFELHVRNLHVLVEFKHRNALQRYTEFDENFLLASLY